jgi:hypothetical protein
VFYLNRPRILKKAILAIHALEALAPEVDFGLTSLAKIRPVHKKTVAANDDVVVGDNAQEGRRIVRDLSMAELQEVLRTLREGIASHPDFGDDSELFGRCGFVRRSERSSGLTRKTKEDSEGEEEQSPEPEE